MGGQAVSYALYDLTPSLLLFVPQRRAKTGDPRNDCAGTVYFFGMTLDTISDPAREWYFRFERKSALKILRKEM